MYSVESNKAERYDKILDCCRYSNFCIPYHKKINNDIRRTIIRKNKIRAIKENLLTAQQNNELFDVQFLDAESAI